MRAYHLILTVCLLLVLQSAHSSLAVELPAFSIQKAQGVCQQIRSRSKEYFKAPALAVRHDLIDYYLRRLAKDKDSFKLADVLSFVTATRSLVLRSEPSQPLLDSWRELDLCFQEIAVANKLEYSSLPEAAYRQAPLVPTDLQTRREEMSFSLHHLGESVGKLQRTLGDSQDKGNARLQSDLAALSQAAQQMQQALRVGQLSDAHFAAFQAARARWEVSRPLLPLLSYQAGAEISGFNQTCCELWRAGK